MGDIVLINSESFEGSYPPSLPSTWTSSGNWAKENNQVNTGTWSADFDGSGTGDLTTSILDCSDASSITIDFWYRDEGCESNEFRLQLWDGNNWDSTDLGSTTPENTWHHYQRTLSINDGNDNQYFHQTFQIRWNANGIDSNEHAYVDDVTITKQPAQYEEGRFSSDPLNTAGATAIHISFTYQVNNTAQTDFQVRWSGNPANADDNTWQTIANLGNTAYNTWTPYSVTIYNATTPSAFTTHFRLQFLSQNLSSGEAIWVDNILITKDIS
jgi:hypothetical protein